MENLTAADRWENNSKIVISTSLAHESRVSEPRLSTSGNGYKTPKKEDLEALVDCSSCKAVITRLIVRTLEHSLSDSITFLELLFSDYLVRTILLAQQAIQIYIEWELTAVHLPVGPWIREFHTVFIDTPTHAGSRVTLHGLVVSILVAHRNIHAD